MTPFSADELHREMHFDPQGRWYVGCINLLGDVRPQGLPQRIVIKDETLREGEETPGVHLTMEDKLRVARALAQVGVQEVEVGYAGSVEEHFAFTQRLKAEGLGLCLSSHARAYSTEEEWKRETERVAKSGAELISYVGYISECRIAGKPWLSKKDFPRRVRDVILFAKGYGLRVAFGLADPVRSQLPLLRECLEAAQEAGVDRYYVYDGPGAATPEAMAYLTTLAKDLTGAQVAVHCHDDYGLALANTLSAVKAGAQVVDAVVNGLGDRAGNAALEEVVAALAVLYGVETGIRLEGLYALCTLVEEVYGVPLAPNKALVGANQYRHATDSHIADILRGGWYTMENIRAEALGRTRTLEFGPAALATERSGAIGALIEALGLEVSEEQFREVLARLRPLVAQRKLVSEGELAGLIREVVASPAPSP